MGGNDGGMLEFFAKPVVRITMGALALLALVVLVVTPAFAHSNLRSVDPSDGSTITSSPPALTLAFTDDVLADFTKVDLLGPDGNLVALAPPVTTRDTVLQVLPPLANGLYRITFRVVSADSHPISGTTTFTVNATAQQSPSPSEAAPTSSSPTAVASPSLSESPTASQSASTSTDASGPTASDTGSSPVNLWLIGGIVALIAAVLAFLVTRRRDRY